MSEMRVFKLLINEASKDLQATVEQIPQGVFERRPAPGLNPPGFLYFHVLRHWDRDVNVHCLGHEPEEDAWHREGFSAELDYEPLGIGHNGTGTGYGYSDTEVDATPMNRDVLMRYHRVLHEDTFRYLDEADEARLHQERTSRHLTENPYRPERWLRHMIAHTYLHIGDIQYAAGAVTTLAGESAVFDAESFPGSPPSA